jgi:small ligand-binding sensory domain FIST
VSQFAAALSQHPLATQATGEVAGAVLEQLDGRTPDLVVGFASPHHAGAFADITAALRRILEPGTFLGFTAASVIGGGREVEDEPALSVFAAALPATSITPVTLQATQTPEGIEISGGAELDDREPDDDSVLLLLADPFSFPADVFLRGLAERAPGVSVVGGLASAASRQNGNLLVLDDAIRTSGAVGALLEGGTDLDGGVRVQALVSQGCRPIGQPFIVTRAEGGLVLELGGRPAVSRLQDLADAASEDDRELLRRGLHVGLVLDEHRAEFGPGDFLVRNLLGADPNSGALVIGEQVRVGQTVQFHVRDAAAADEDLHAVLLGETAAAGLVFTCTGRGQHLFGAADHDASAVHAHLGPIPLAGAFCAGEIGPVGGRSFLHTFTASIALFQSGRTV